MSSVDHRDVHVLLIEPDQSFDAAVRGALLNYRCLVESAANGTDAWMILATFKHRFDVIALDLSLPDLDGLELLAKIRRSPKHQGVPVVVCTERTHREEVAAAIRHGVRHYVVKPCLADVVARKLLDVLAGARAAVTARTPAETACVSA
jgi:DNA-binding response OmpR family regulator